MINLQAQEELNVYLGIAAQNNSELKNKFNQYMAALEIIPQVGQLPDPSIAFGFFIQPIETRFGPQHAKFSLSQMAPWFGTLKAKEDQAVLSAKAKFEIFEEAKSHLFNDVKQTYFNIYFLNKAIFITSENIRILESLQKLVLIKIEAGTALTIDEFRVQMEINELNNELLLLQDKLFASKVMFNNLLNVETHLPINIPEQLWDEDIISDKQDILNLIIEKNNQLQSLEYQFESLLKQQTVVEKKGLPNINIGMDYAVIGKGENSMPGIIPGKDALMFPHIGITLPVFRNKYKAMVKEIMYLQEAKKEEKINKINILETIFENTFNDYKNATRKIKLYTEQNKLATHSLKIIESIYATDGKNFEDVLLMIRRLLKYNLELEKAHVDKHVAIAFVNYLIGK